MERGNDQQVISGWAHLCEPTMVQITHGPLTHCNLCHECNLNRPLVKLFEISSPFKSSIAARCDLLLIPSNRQTRLDFDTRSGLHIGISDRLGRVLEFDVDGLVFDDQERLQSTWHRCIPLGYLARTSSQQKASESLKEVWDRTVIALKDSNEDRKYDEENFNCLDFVLDFLDLYHRLLETNQRHTSAQEQETSARLAAKVSFCQDFVVPCTTHAARYMVLERKLEAGESVIKGPVDQSRIWSWGSKSLIVNDS